MEILLIEPGYKNKYPPLGLMKISSFHKERGDNVHFIKGLNKDYKNKSWDRIYISTLFSFFWDSTIETIRYYEYSIDNPQNLFIGGPMATIMAEEIRNETGYKPVVGLLNEEGKINIKDDHTIDCTIPDYGILNEISYKYINNDAYYFYTTRGCIRKCPFCAVPKIEPIFQDYISLKEHIKAVNERYGEKKDLLLLDNNVLASNHFERIIDDIKEVGFFKGSKLNNRNRYVDFNQGVDLRLLSKEKIKRLSEIAIKPLRIAFDDINYKEDYIKKVTWSAEYGLLNLSNYILYNYNDTPEDFYERLKINIELNEMLGTKIFSFPMKYIPVKSKHRNFVSKNWNPKFLRGIQCVLNATHGVVSPKREFFEAAFGKNADEFKQIIMMPDDYILFREKHKKNGAKKLIKSINGLSKEQMNDFNEIVLNKNYQEKSSFRKVNNILKHYKN